MPTIPDSRYIPINFMQEYFVDKDSGCPMSAGIVTFYRDSSRLVKKPVYKINFDGTNYTYTALPNPIILSSVGTFMDGSGNDVTAYYYPYDAGGDLDLYYAVVKNSGEVSQFTREGQPTIDTAAGNESDIVNFVPNGQFLLHNNLTESTTTEEGEIVSDVTEIAPGNWTFERSSGSTASDFVLFERLSSAVQEPTDNPRYQVRVLCNAPDITDEIKGLRLQFNDVNKFSDTGVGEVTYTYSFEGASNGASALPISVNLIKNYGTGGDAEETILQASINLETGTNRYNIPILFPTNDGKILGEDDDDFLQLEIAIPASSALDCVLNNFSLEEGTTTATSFPIQTNSQMLYRTLPGSMPIPDYDGMDLYLPTILGPNGLIFDDSDIGKLTMTPLENFEITYLSLRGMEYLVSGKDPRSGIPYRRLYEKWSAAEASTGKSFVGLSPAYVSADPDAGFPTDDIRLYTYNSTNTTAPADGTPASGFSFSVNNATWDFKITTVAASSVTAGANFTFHDTTARKYVCWYEIDGIGTQPTVSGTEQYIKVSSAGSASADDLAQLTIQAINGLYIYLPDLRGYFLRNWDYNRGIDPDAGSRVGGFGVGSGDRVATTQGDEFESHVHDNYMRADHNGGAFNPDLARDPLSTGVSHALGHMSDGDGIYTPSPTDLVTMLGFVNVAQGGNETRPINWNMQIIVKY